MHAVSPRRRSADRARLCRARFARARRGVALASTARVVLAHSAPGRRLRAVPPALLRLSATEYLLRQDRRCWLVATRPELPRLCREGIRLAAGRHLRPLSWAARAPSTAAAATASEPRHARADGVHGRGHALSLAVRRADRR